LVRILLDPQFRLVDADLAQQFDGALARLFVVQVQVHLHGFHQLAFHRLQGVERSQRILEDHADAAAAHLALLGVAQGVDAASFQQDLAASQPAGRLQQADDGVADGRFAGAGLAHHAEDLALLQRQRNAVDGHQRAAPAREFDAYAVDVQQCHERLSAAWG